jgi:ATP-binding cassette subfamily B (MDR/TAP) protein 1
MQIGISEKLGTMLQYTALVIGAYVIAFKYSWQLTLVTSSSLVFVCLIYSGIVPIWIKLQKSIDHANGKATAIASETLGAIRMVVACGAEDRVAKRHSGWIEEARRQGLKESPLFGFQMAPVFFCIFATFALTFWFGVRLFNQGIIDSVGTVLM